ncbi:MAG: hypothetical protein IJF37_05200 [Lachnospiraceae bacterium]|nr:hypothetical protein [Lachnospiraceae bacterium]
MSDIRKYMKERKHMEQQEEDDQLLEKKLKRHKRGKITKWIIVIAVLVIVAVCYYIYMKNKTYTEYETVENVEVTDTYNCSFYEFGDYMLRYSEDGLAYLNGSETYWNQAFQMKQPLLDVCNEYVAVADQKGNTVYICNTDSQQGKIETEYPIMDIDVSADGIVAAITGDESDVSHIEVIEKDGTKIAKGQTVLSGQGCPVDLSISEDGTKLVVSYLYVASGVIESKVVFYNYSEVGKNEVDRFVGGFDYDKTMMAKVEFITNDIVAAFGDDKLVIYSMKQKPSIIAEIKVDKEIKSVFYNAEYMGLVIENNEAENPYTMVVYDLEGDMVSETKFNFMYKDIKIADESIVIYNDTSLKVYNVEGTLKYEGEIEEGIASIITKKDYSYYVVGPSSIKYIKLK